MTKNQREFQKELARLERSIARLTKKHDFIQSVDLPAQPKRVSRRHIKRLQELKGKHFISQIDTETGEVIHEAPYQEIYKHKQRTRSYYKREYDAEKARAYREAHREQIAEANKRYREKHKDQIREKQRAYRESHKEQIHEKARAYRQANKQRINAGARRRRRQKKLEKTMTVAPTAFSVYDELFSRFQEAKRKAVEPFLNDKLWCMDKLIVVLGINRSSMGEGDYTAYLKKREQDIAEYIDILVFASTQSQTLQAYSIVLDIINAVGMVIPKKELEPFSNLSESGDW